MTEIERIQELEAWIKEIGLHTDVLQKSDVIPLDVLLAYLGDEKDHEKFLQFNFLPLQESEGQFTKLIQFYSVLPGKISDETIGSLLYTIKEINNITLVGNFGITAQDKISFRYVFAQSSVVDSKITFLETVNFAVITIKMFSELLENVANGSTSIEDALDHLAAMHG